MVDSGSEFSENKSGGAIEDISYANPDDVSEGLSLEVDPERNETIELTRVNSDELPHKAAGTKPNASNHGTGGDDNGDAPLGSRGGEFCVPVGDVTCWKHTSGFVNFFTLTWGWLVCNKSQILSGITVALAQVPEAVSFSFVAGVEPIVGLQSAWLLGICTSLFGGRPGMVAGATGAVAIVLPSIVEKHGIGYMFYAIMLAGIIQMIFGFLRLGVLVRMIPHPVMVGFCNGLGIVIGVAQFNIFKVRPEENVEDGRRLFETFGAFAPFTNGWDWVERK